MIVPVDAPVAAPLIVAFWIVLLVASLMYRIVLVLAVALVCEFEIVKPLPPVFKPLRVTLSAPLKSINGEPATIAPEIVRTAPPVGEIVTEVHAPPVATFKTAGAVSAVSAVMLIRMTLPVCVTLALSASNAPFNVVYVASAPVEPVTVTCADALIANASINPANNVMILNDFIKSLLSSNFF